MYSIQQSSNDQCTYMRSLTHYSHLKDLVLNLSNDRWISSCIILLHVLLPRKNDRCWRPPRCVCVRVCVQQALGKAVAYDSQESPQVQVLPDDYNQGQNVAGTSSSTHGPYSFTRIRSVCSCEGEYISFYYRCIDIYGLSGFKNAVHVIGFLPPNDCDIEN